MTCHVQKNFEEGTSKEGFPALVVHRVPPKAESHLVHLVEVTFRGVFNLVICCETRFFFLFNAVAHTSQDNMTISKDRRYIFYVGRKVIIVRDQLIKEMLVIWVNFNICLYPSTDMPVFPSIRIHLPTCRYTSSSVDCL